MLIHDEHEAWQRQIVSSKPRGSICIRAFAAVCPIGLIGYRFIKELPYYTFKHIFHSIVLPNITSDKKLQVWTFIFKNSVVGTPNI